MKVQEWQAACFLEISATSYEGIPQTGEKF